MYIKENTYIDNMKDIKNKIVDYLIKITKDILSIFYSHPCYSYTLENTDDKTYKKFFNH